MSVITRKRAVTLNCGPPLSVPLASELFAGLRSRLKCPRTIRYGIDLQEHLLRLAQKILKDILERAGTGDTLRTPSIKDWLTDWIATKEAHKAASTGRLEKTVGL